MWNWHLLILHKLLIYKWKIVKNCTSGIDSDIMEPVSWARAIVDFTIDVNGILSSFKRFPVCCACRRPNFVNILSASVLPSRLYWPWRIKIKCRTAFGLYLSFLYFSSSVRFASFLGFCNAEGLRLKI